MLVVPEILRVFLLSKLDSSLFPELSVGFEHSCSSISHNRIAKSRYIDLVPRSQEDNVTLQNLILKSRTKRSIWCSFLNSFFYCTSYTTHSLNLGSSELCYLKSTREHALDKGSVFHNLVRFTYKLELFHDFELSVKLNYHSCYTEAEMRNIELVPSLVLLV